MSSEQGTVPDAITEQRRAQKLKDLEAKLAQDEKRRMEKRQERRREASENNPNDKDGFDEVRRRRPGRPPGRSNTAVGGPTPKRRRIHTGRAAKEDDTPSLTFLARQKLNFDDPQGYNNNETTAGPSQINRTPSPIVPSTKLPPSSLPSASRDDNGNRRQSGTFSRSFHPEIDTIKSRVVTTSSSSTHQASSTSSTTTTEATETPSSSSTTKPQSARDRLLASFDPNFRITLNTVKKDRRSIEEIERDIALRRRNDKTNGNNNNNNSSNNRHHRRRTSLPPTSPSQKMKNINAAQRERMDSLNNNNNNTNNTNNNNYSSIKKPVVQSRQSQHQISSPSSPSSKTRLSKRPMPSSSKSSPNKPVTQQKKKYTSANDENDDDDDYYDDDNDDDNQSTIAPGEVTKMMWEMFGKKGPPPLNSASRGSQHDKNDYDDYYDGSSDDMEAGADQVFEEEEMSKKIAKNEDLAEERAEEARKREKGKRKQASHKRS